MSNRKHAHVRWMFGFIQVQIGCVRSQLKTLIGCEMALLPNANASCKDQMYLHVSMCILSDVILI